MIGYLTAEEKPLSRDLWEEAFPEDSREFDDYYYKVKVKENRILALREPEELVAAAEAGAVSAGNAGADGGEEVSRIDAMIQLNPYRLQVRNRRWRADYLVGVATRKDRRHRGYMRRLLVQMMADMRDEGMPFCFLMPADEAIYRPFGFTYIFDQPRWRLRDGYAEGLRRRNAAEIPSAAADWMRRWMENRYQVFSVRDEAYVRMLLAEAASENGRLEALYDGSNLVGFQSMWGWGKQEQRLLYAEERYLEEAAPPKPAIMARIITPEEFVKVIRLRDQVKASEITVPLLLEDPLIERNDGLWLWHLNHEMSWLERSTAEVQPDAVLAEAMLREDSSVGRLEPQVPVRLTITELTSWLFGYSVPEAAQAL